ncbi:MAG: hypothetical protein A2252_07170 [Elusimicrobia bacterium RIFOXYA2_FULL_39_19]|nr:MAG: hypothetical protein A2252_07170 [Elusimicrobia bacterium RIFOXYA2_FULL_39_19]
MYLKSVELCGFKSFADKTQLTFDRQISAVVGPNGCGKSNVVDAIRWCLGEQSANSLRSPHMMGVVFNGSQSRAPMNIAEASLTFDNSSNILPIDYTEVTVTRRLFRSGESEYYINKVQCRLKDIRDLFLDTGIGKEGYSIFEQGKVELLTNAKPEDRRAFFEEAAGVSKYKVRREETLRKLDRIHQDMNRVNDIISVIKEQISALESAVRKAKLYQKHQDELRTLEIADSTKKIFQLDTDLTPLTTQIDELNKTNLEKNTQRDQLEAELANIQVEKSVLDKELQDAYTKLNQIDTEIAKTEERISVSQVRIKEFKDRQETLRNNIANFESTKKSIEDQINIINAELHKAEETVAEHIRIHDEKKANHEGIKNNISSNQLEQSKINSRIFELIEKRKVINNELASISDTVSATKTSIHVQNHELKKIQSEQEELEKTLTAMQAHKDEITLRVTSVKTEYETITTQIQQCKQEIEILATEKDAMREQFYSLNSRMEALREIQQKDPKINTAHHIVSNNFHGIHCTVNSLLNVSEIHAGLVSNLLSDKLNYLVADTVTDAKNAITYLEQNKKGCASFIILETLPDLPETKMLGIFGSERPIASVVSYEPQWDKLFRFLFHNTYFSGTTIHQDAIMHGGVSETRQLSPELECKAIQEQINTFKVRETTCEEQLKLKEAELANLLENHNIKNNEVQQATYETASAEKEFTATTERLKLTDMEVETINSDIKRLTEEEIRLEGNAPALKTELEEVEKGINSLQAELSLIDNVIQELREKEHSAGTEYTEAAKNLSTYEERLKSYKREYETLTSNLKIQEDQHTQSVNEIQMLDGKVTEQENIFTNESKNIDTMYETRRDADKKIEDLQAKYNQIYLKVEHKQGQLSTLRTELNALSQQIHELQIIQKTKEIERQNLEKSLMDSGIDYNSIKDNYLNIEVDPEEITRLRRRIDSMGPVNLTAQEQYTDLEKRYTFLTQQQQDLSKAEEDIRSAITKINTSIQQSFHETFDKVRENFKQIFNQLFEGGEADLSLTDENNLLESGIEIFAQPQGKKLQSITLLSGGEKALTAIALLFSFFMVKPSPICILDEVDAPLDESNVTRFINIIKTFSSKSQFLMITHNKKSMEAADILYGVTMEEYGISNIISIRLSKQEVPGLISEKLSEETVKA